MSFINVALITGGAALLGGAIASSGARSAASTQADAATQGAAVQAQSNKDALALQEKQYNQQVALQEPYRQAGLTGQNSVEAGITKATAGAYKFGQQLKSTLVFVVSIKDELLILAGIIAAVFVANKVIAFVVAIQTLITAMVALRNAAAAAGVATAFATGGASVGTAAAALAAAAATYGLTQIAPSGNIPSPSTFSGTPFGQAGGNTYNISVQSVDSEGAARAVAKVLNDSASRSVPQLFNSGIKGG